MFDNFIHSFFETLNLSINTNVTKINTNKKTNIQLTVTGVSENTHAITLYFRELGFLFGAGELNSNLPEIIFILDGRYETTSHLVNYILNHQRVISKEHRNKNIKTKKSNILIYTPQKLKSQIENLVNKTFEMTKNSDIANIKTINWDIVGLPESEIVTNIKGQVYAFQMYGNIITIHQYRNKLKPEYANMTQEEINKHSKNGHIVSSLEKFPLFCYIPKINKDEFNLYKSIIGEMPIVFLECDYIDDIHYEYSIKENCLHWNDIKEFIEMNNNTKFVLHHFNLMYQKTYLFDFFKQENVYLFVNKYENYPNGMNQTMFDIISGMTKSITINNNSDYEIDISGFSESAKATAFYSRNLGDISFDAGYRYAPFLPTNIFITHCHIDHVANMPKFVIMAINSNKKINIWMSPVMYHRLKKFIKGYVDLHFGEEQDIEKYINKNFVSPNNVYEWGDYLIETFKCDHGTPCTGYGLSKYGNNILCFVGDTSKSLLKSDFGKNILCKYKTIIIECTYIGGIGDDIKGDLKQAKENKHIHWNDLKEYIREYENNNYILCHFSSKYSNDYIIEFFNNCEKYNIIVFVNKF